MTFSERRQTKRAVRRAETGPRPPLGAREAFLLLGGYLAAQLTAGVALGIAATGTGEDLLTATDQLGEVAAAALAAGLVAGAFVVAWIFRRYARASDDPAALYRQVGFRMPLWSHVVLAALGGIVIGSGLIFLSTRVPMPPDMPTSAFARMAQADGWPRLVWATAAIFIAPPVEEFLFRGVVLEGLRRSWGLGIAATLATFLFVALHLPEAWFYWPAVLGVSVAAVALLAARLGSRSLGPPIALHFFYNLTIVLMVFASG